MAKMARIKRLAGNHEGFPRTDTSYPEHPVNPGHPAHIFSYNTVARGPSRLYQRQQEFTLLAGCLHAGFPPSPTLPSPFQ